MDVEKKFPAGMRVLVVDDDQICLRVIERILQICEYDVTAVLQAEVALDLLRVRKGSADQFDLVITDVHMPGMEGFKLMELINLEMDIPVIMLSADDRMAPMLEGVKFGAADYILKPVHMAQVKSLWTHVVRKGRRYTSYYTNDAGQKSKPRVADGENECAKKTRKYSRKKTIDGHGTKADNDNKSIQKRPRINWFGPLHHRFLEAVHYIGLDNAVPKKILALMNVNGLTTANIASHLQKYRIYLRNHSVGTIRHSNPLSDESKWNEWGSNSNGSENFMRNSDIFQGGSQLKDAAVSGSQQGVNQFTITFGKPHLNMSGEGKPFLSDPSGSTIANTSNGIEFNSSNSLPSGSSGNMFGSISVDSLTQARSTGLPSYGSMWRQKILGASRGIPVDDDDDFQSIADGNILAPNNLLRAQPPQLENQLSVQMQTYAHLSNGIAIEPSGFASLSIITNTGKTDALPEFDELGYKDGPFKGPSQGNNLTINQFFGYEATSGQMPNFGNEFQNQIDTVMSEETIPNVGFSRQMAPVNLERSRNSVVMPKDNYTLASAPNIIGTQPNIEDAIGNLPANDNTVCLPDVADELMNNNGSLVGASEAHGMTDDLLDIDISELPNFFIDDPYMDGDLNFDLPNSTL